MTRLDQQKLIQDWFTTRSLTSDQSSRVNKLRSLSRDLAYQFLETSPICVDQTVALRMLREALMQMEATIACNERAGEPQ